MGPVRQLFNIIGGILTLTSTVLPWRMLNEIPHSVFEVWSLGIGLALIVPFLVLFGGGFSVFSRYGGAITVAGAIAYVAALPAEFGLGYNSTPPTSSSGAGFWIVWAGAIISLMGKSWNLPFLQRLSSSLWSHKARGPTKAESPDSAKLSNQFDFVKST